MQEAMLACIDIYKPEYIVSEHLGLLNFVATPHRKPNFTATPQQMLMRRIPMTLFCEMANAVIGEDGELLEYKPLIANPKTQKIWSHLYGNEIGRLAQGIPGRNTGTSTFFFIHKNQVPKDRAREVTCDLITTLVRPEKIDELNQTRLVAGGTGYTTPATPAHPPPTYSP